MDSEIVNVKVGKKVVIIFKVNNFVDKGLINKLYGVSVVGVKICMIICGMCFLVFGVEGVSDNIEIISIIDCFFEYFCVLVVYNDGNL